MEDASGVDLQQFRRWYKQAGTPEITVKENFDAANRIYTLELSQSTPATAGQDKKLPFHIPVKVSLIDRDAKLVPIQMAADLDKTGESTVLNLVEKQQRFEFINVEEKPVLSILQGYSAPVKLNFEREDEELAFCMAHEADDFNRWEAGSAVIITDNPFHG